MGLYLKISLKYITMLKHLYEAGQGDVDLEIVIACEGMLAQH